MPGYILSGLMARELLLGLLAIGISSHPSAAAGCVCTLDQDPVCARGDDGSLSTFGNSCQAGCAGAAIVQYYACEELMPHQRGFDTGIWPGSCICPYQYDPVCSSDGETAPIPNSASNCVLLGFSTTSVAQGPT